MRGLRRWPAEPRLRHSAIRPGARGASRRTARRRPPSTLLTGALFPLALLGLGGWLFPAQAAGSRVRRGGVVVGSSLIAQRFVQARYFHPRGSAAGAGWDAAQSGGANLAPADPALFAAVRAAAADYRARNGVAAGVAPPVDAVTRSASGLDPEISPGDAALQAGRVARARGLAPGAVAALVKRHTRGRDLGVLGAPRVSVLALNLALDAAAPVPANPAQAR